MSGFFQHGVRVGRFAVVLAVIISVTMSGIAYAACGAAPTVVFVEAALDVWPSDTVTYTANITNNHTSSCDLDVSTSGDGAGFSSSLTAGTPFTVAAGATVPMTVEVSAGALAIGTTNTTTLTVEAVNTDATTTVNNQMLHNSFNLGSTKHGGNWGLAGGQYGAITCSTCHAKNTGNIKRVRNSISAASGSFPGNAQPVDLQTVEDGTSHFGDDSGSHTTSSRVCEVCHSITKYHRYDTTNQVADGGSLAHFNNKDCTQCHAHNEGFKAGACSGCHGGGTTGAGGKNFWPDGSNANLENDDPGRHEEHMSALASLVYGLANSAVLLDDPAADSKQTDLCGYCHDSPGGDADHGNAADLPAEVAMHPAWSKATAASGSYTTADGNCTNICHNNHPTGTVLYGWKNAVTSQCIMCHNDVTTSANTTGNTHIDHTGASTDFGVMVNCDDCHDAATSWASNTKPANNHIDGTLDAGGNVTLTYDGTSPPGTSFGSCGTNDCHNAGTGTYTDAPVNSTYTWDNNNLSDCGICHLAAPDSNNHPSHITADEDKYGSTANASWDAYDTNPADTANYDFGCGNCHGDTLNNHLNQVRNVSGNGWGGGTCSAAYCHSYKDHDGVTTLYNSPPLWSSAGFTGPDKCAECHHNSPISAGHEEHQIGFHYNAVYANFKDFLPVTDADPLPIGLTTGAFGRDQLRGHGGLLDSDRSANSTTMSCYVCHNDTVTDKFNDLDPVCGACHNATDAPLMGTLTVADKNRHVNGSVDIVFMREKVRSKAQVRDDLMDVPELNNNWTRMNNYKLPDGSSYDESPDTLFNMSATYGGYNATTMTCMISCHLWEDNRVDKYPVHWYENSRHNPDTSKHLMCIDCHTRLPK